MSDIPTQTIIVSQIGNQKEKGSSGASGQQVGQRMWGCHYCIYPFTVFYLILLTLSQDQKKKKEKGISVKKCVLTI